MVAEEFNNDLYQLRRNIKCVSLMTCGDDWKRSICTIMAGMICAGKPDYFDQLVFNAKNSKDPEVQREARQSIAGINLYMSNIYKNINNAGGDSYDALGTAQQISFMLEETGKLPTPEEVAHITGDEISLKSLGIRKPRIEYTETEAEFEKRRKNAEKQRQEQCEEDHKKGRTRVRIHFDPERRHIKHNEKMTVSVDVIKGFEDFYTGNWIDTPKPLEALNDEISDAGANKFVAKRTIKDAGATPGAMA